MKKPLLLCLLSFGCTIRAIQFELPECDAGPPACEGDVSVSCVDRKIEQENCAPGLCDPASGLCVAAVCGDGIVDFNEACDDNNLAGGDGCDTSCLVEPGFVCINEPSECAQTCGNGTLDVGEECDDGNTSNGDGCSDTCLNEFCGDGIINNISESCDDANLINTDDCLDTCQIALCGDGVLQAGVDECDDGNNADGDGCNSSCILEVCGDGIINNNNEDCDDANTINGDGCDSQCFFEGDIFVLCDGGVGGNGSQTNPFHSLQAGVAAASEGGTVSMLPGSICESTFIDKSLTVQGLRDETGAPPRVEANSIAINVGGVGATVLLKDFIVEAVFDNGAINVEEQTTDAHLALIRLDVANTSTGPNASAVDCSILTGLATLLIDQSVVRDSPSGGLTMRNCEAIVANSLFSRNGSVLINRGAIEVNTPAFVEVFFSTFDNNQGVSTLDAGSDQGTIIDVDGVSTGSIDSSILNDTNIDSDGSLDFFGGTVSVSFCDTFGSTTQGTGNLNADPLFVSIAGFDFHLGNNSPARESANPNPNATLFDPQTLFGVDPFVHDLLGNARPNGDFDMGCIEE